MSGKQSRRQRQTLAAKEPSAVKGPSAGRKASPKILLAILAVLLLVGAAVGIASVLRGGSSESSSPQPVAGAARVQSLFHGIAQHGNVLGRPSAPVTLVEYADLQCPYCRDFGLQAEPSLIKRYVRTGHVKVVFRPLAFLGPDSVRGRNAVIAAGLQNRLFDVVQLLYTNQGVENSGWLDDKIVEAAARSVPSIEVGRLLADKDSAAVTRKAQTFDSQATADGVHSTPTVLVGKTGGALRQVDGTQLSSALASLAS
jgi:protein-disulfide isomerase